MEMEIIYNENLHFEHQLWRRELFFWQDELKFFNNRLSELITRWTSKEVLVKLEHYQNEFILHGGVIEDLLEAIEVHGGGRGALDPILFQKHLEFRNKMETQRQIYTDLKKEFFPFLGQYQ